MNDSIDAVRLHFDQSNLTVLNLCLGFIMFGVALGLEKDDFRRILTMPRLVLLGFLSQFVALPALTFLFIAIVQPIPSIALGLFLVAACPGGNISNFISVMSKGNVALSITLTAIATCAATVLTPFNFAFWGSLNPTTAPLIKAFDLNFWDMFRTVLLLLGLPLMVGVGFKYQFPDLAARIIKPVQRVSLVIFAAFIIGALASNFSYFLKYIHTVFFLVLLHNGLALFTGYGVGHLAKVSEADRRTFAIETGIQNTGLGLVIVFNFFDGLGGMAVLAAWWGIWDMVAGLMLGYFWSKRKPAE